MVVVGALLGSALSASAASAGTDIACHCVANGTTYGLGQVICLKLGTKPFMARCEQVLNNTSWKKLQDGCPSAQLTPIPDQDSPKKISTATPDS